MARSVATTRTTASRRSGTVNFPYSLSFAAATSNIVTLDTAILFDSTQTFALAFWVDLSRSAVDAATTQRGLCTLTTDQGVAFSVRYQAGGTGTQYIGFGADSLMVGRFANMNAYQQARRGWHHVCITFDGVDRTATGSYKIYVDGTERTTGTLALSAITNTSWIGRAGSSLTGAKNITRFRIWNGGSTMTAAQVLDLYHDDIVPSGPTLTREYLFTDGSGTQLTETVGSFHGTISTATWSSSSPKKTRTASTVRTVAS